MENIKNIIPTVFEQMTVKKAEDQGKIFRAWESLIDGKMVKHCLIDGFQDGVLNVNVDSSAWLFQMNCHKTKILEILQEEIPDLKKIFFKIGKVK